MRSAIQSVRSLSFFVGGNNTSLFLCVRNTLCLSHSNFFVFLFGCPRPISLSFILCFSSEFVISILFYLAVSLSFCPILNFSTFLFYFSLPFFFCPTQFPFKVVGNVCSPALRISQVTSALTVLMKQKKTKQTNKWTKKQKNEHTDKMNKINKVKGKTNEQIDERKNKKGWTKRT